MWEKKRASRDDATLFYLGVCDALLPALSLVLSSMVPV